MNIAYLLIGGNLGNRSANLQKAIQLIEQNCMQTTKYNNSSNNFQMGNNNAYRQFIHSSPTK
jgi:7,8-dihydro-6-hydroxymethylpterin-pyrophosphokinase